MAIPYTDCVFLVTFPGWLEMWLAWAGVPRALHIVGALVQQLKLKWAWIMESLGSPHSGSPGRLVKLHASWGVLELYMQKVPWQDK